MQGERGKLKFIKIPSVEEEYAGEKTKIEGQNINKNCPESPLDRTDDIEVDMEMMKTDIINDGMEKKMCNCLKTISSVSRHQCVRPSYRSFSNSNGAILKLFVQASKCHGNTLKSHFLPQKVLKSTI